jgi:phytoene synthase
MSNLTLDRDETSAQSAAPPTAVEPLAIDYDIEACTELMRGGSKSFFAASRLLPARVRAPAIALYAFCRLADDAIDNGTDQKAAMRDLKARLAAIYAGRPGREDADRALTVVVHRYRIPMGLVEALLDGFLWDSEGRRYETLADVEAYGARVAGTVGAMMSLIMGAASQTAIARACELGVAMQLTNIARDIGEDARNGRLYIPRTWFREIGMDADDWLANPLFDARIGGFAQRLLLRADALYRRGEFGLIELPRDCRPAIQAARLVYAEIGHQLERTGLNSVDHRSVVPMRRKLALIARATATALRAPALPAVPLSPVPAIHYLVDIVRFDRGDADEVERTGVPRRSFDERIEWMVDLFERLEQRGRTVR